MGLLDFLNTPYAVVIVLLLFAFLPPILFLIWVRNTERYGREPWFAVIKVFVWGAVFAVIISVILTLALTWLYNKFAPAYDILGTEQTLFSILVVLVVAPFVEEAAKALGIYTTSYNINEPEDGIVYGAASGLGFSATENLFYGIAALVTLGPTGSITLIVVRSISSTLLHASATSTTGLGVGRNMVSEGKVRVAPYYLIAVAMHASYNFFASFGTIYESSFGENGYLFGFVVAWIFAIIALSILRGKIAKSDHGATSRWRRAA